MQPQVRKMAVFVHFLCVQSRAPSHRSEVRTTVAPMENSQGEAASPCEFSIRLMLRCVARRQEGAQWSDLLKRPPDMSSAQLSSDFRPPVDLG